MAAFPDARWRVVPASSFAPVARHCSDCGGDRRFHCSERFRLNANGHRLDAWLIYRCEHCDNRWNAPVFRRRPIGTIEPARLAALERSERQFAIEVAATIAVPDTFELVREGPPSPVIELAVPTPLAVRLDRVLAAGLRTSRRQIADAALAGTIEVAGGHRRLRQRVRDGQVVALAGSD